MTKSKKNNIEEEDEDIDPVKEIRAYRDAIAKKFNYDPVAIFEYVRKESKKRVL